MEFEGFEKIPRLSREIVITEKIDGTNACVCIDEAGNMYTGSRKRWITPEDDNYGFARWAEEHKEELFQLGPGRHFGEWWGKGVQRGYGLNEKRLSLFNVSKWSDDLVRPACCSVVPVLYRGGFDTERIKAVMNCLGEWGSVAAPGFMDPEGIIIYHTAGNLYFKKTLKNDDKPKGSKE